jgi:hypothetical protein
MIANSDRTVERSMLVQLGRVLIVTGEQELWSL